MRKLPSSPPYVFDNDCLASFLWVKRVDVLYALFAGQVAVPDVVLGEFRYLAGTRSGWVYDHVVAELASGRLAAVDIPPPGPVAEDFARLQSGRSGKALGKGESAVLAWVRFNGGTVASNNLGDVAAYCARYRLGLISTDDILCLACTKGLLTEREGHSIWEEMKRRKRKLPSYDFGEALRRFTRDLPK